MLFSIFRRLISGKKWVILSCSLLGIGIALSLSSFQPTGSVILLNTTSTPFWLPKQTPLPFPVAPTLSPQEQDKFSQVAREFTHPQTRPISEKPVTAQILLENPATYDGYHIAIKGEVIRIASVQYLLEHNWETAYIVIVDDNSAWLPVVYRGDATRFIPGDIVQAEGAFSASGLGLHADTIVMVQSPFQWIETVPKNLIVAFIIVILIGILALALLVIHRPTLPVISILVILLVSCEFHVETVIHQDGSVLTSIFVNEDSENVEWFRKIPGINRYMKSWQVQLQEDGTLVENFIKSNQEYFVLKKDYPDLVSYSRLDENTLSPDSWVYATSFDSGNQHCTRFQADINPKHLSDTSTVTDSNASREIERYLNNMDFHYSVTMPGKIVYSNSIGASKKRVDWLLDMDRSNELVAESCQTLPVEISWRWGWGIIAGIFIIDLGLLRRLFWKYGKNR